MQERHSAGRACAECRRLKHKCDRQVPCSNCIKKGCHDICPTGTNTTGEGHRRFWARTYEMRDTLSKLAERIADLEGALRSERALNSSSAHPLLAEPLLKLKEPYLAGASTQSLNSDSDRNSSPRADDADNVGDLDNTVVALGSLSITHSGRTTYYGSAAFSPFFFRNEEPENRSAHDGVALPLLPSDIATVGSSSFPLSILPRPTDANHQDRLITLRCFLPSPEDVHRLKSAYYRHGVSMNDPISVEEFDTIIFKAVYDRPWTDAPDFVEHHRLAVVFLVLALGSLFDPVLPMRSIDASKYYELACAALFGSSAVESPTIESIQALCLVCSYIQFSHKGTDNSGNVLEWTIMGMAVKMAQTMGLHRDPRGFDLPPDETERRRRLWWNVYCQDVWGALRWSLPASVTSSSFDTKMPSLDDTSTSNLIYLWRWSFCRDCVEPLQQRVFSVERPSYTETVLELDRQLRAHPVPELLQYRVFALEDLLPENSMVSLQRTFVAMMRESVILQLHRNYCDAATREHAADPFSSPYGSSVIACFRSAWALLSVAATSYEVMAHPTARIPCIYYQLFTGAAALSSIISRCPSLQLVPDALGQLGRADQLARTWVSTVEAESLLNTMTELVENARASYAAYASEGHLPASEERREAVLARLGGKTRCVLRLRAVPVVAPPSNPAVAPFEMPLEEVHPSVLQYLHALQLGY